MGSVCSIDLVVEFTRPTQVIDALIEYGWIPNRYGQLAYMVVPEAQPEWDISHWDSDELGKWEQVRKILQQQETQPNHIGIYLCWKTLQDNEGIPLIFPNTFVYEKSVRKVHIGLDDDKQKITETRDNTDFSWYLTRILPPLNKKGLQVLEVTCTDNSW